MKQEVVVGKTWRSKNSIQCTLPLEMAKDIGIEVGESIVFTKVGDSIVVTRLNVEEFLEEL